MRSDKRKVVEKKVEKHSKFKKFTMVWSIFFMLMTIAFIGVLVHMNVLVPKLLAAAIAVVGTLFIINFLPLFSKKFKHSRRVIGLIFSILMIAIYGLGISYMMGTLDFLNKISAAESEKEAAMEYYLIVNKANGYENINQLEGENVRTFLTNDINYSKAKNQLKEVVNIQYEMSEDLNAMGLGIMDGTHKALFLSKNHYDTIYREQEPFRNGTKILHTVKVMIPLSELATELDVTKEAFNVYISGLDTEGSIEIDIRSDVNMIMTVNPITHKILLTSLPRDYYVRLAGQGDAMDKLTHTGIYGIQESVKSVENVTGLDMDYFVKVNYSTVTQFIDAIGGIDVYSDFAFTTHGQKVYFNYVEGNNHLDGVHTLAFARERKSFTDGDFQRNKNQQKIVKAVIEKVMASPALLTEYNSILKAMADTVRINMTPADMQALVKMQLAEMPSWDIDMIDMVGVPDWQPCYSLGNEPKSVVTPDNESVVSCVDKIIEVMSGKEKKAVVGEK